jgi:hypothetical protein
MIAALADSTASGISLPSRIGVIPRSGTPSPSRISVIPRSGTLSTICLTPYNDLN